jgi:hypothetical protein
MLLIRKTLSRLTNSTILIRTHFHSKSNQYLFHTHVAIPAAQSRYFTVENFSILIDTGHVNAGNETDFWWFSRILVCALDA